MKALVHILLHELGIVKVSGLQSAEFLQGQVTLDISEVTATQSRLGAHCNPKGRVLATFHLFYKDPDYYLVLPREMVGFLLKELNKYARFYKIKLEDVSSILSKVGLIGHDVAKIINDLFKEDVALDRVYTQAGITGVMMPGVIPRVILFQLEETPLKAFASHSQPFTYWENIDVLSGIVSIVPKIQGLFTPHHLNLPQKGGVSFTKGCYIGQEIIARMHYLGQLKQSLYRLTFSSEHPPLPGIEIIDSTQNAQGTLLTVVPQVGSPDTNSYQALAVIQKTAIKNPLYIEDRSIASITLCKD